MSDRIKKRIIFGESIFMKKIILCILMYFFLYTSYSQLKINTGNLCDDGKKYNEKLVTFTCIYSSQEQGEEILSLRGKSEWWEDLYRLSTYAGFDKMKNENKNEKYYTRRIESDCTMLLRIPFNITVPNTLFSPIKVTGYVADVSESLNLIIIRVTQISRVQ